MVNRQELPEIAEHLKNPLPRTSKFYLLPKIHNVDNLGRPIVSACNCPTERIAEYLDEVLRPIVESLPTYVRDSAHTLRILQDLHLPDDDLLLFTMDVKSLYTSIPHDEGIRALRAFLDRRTHKCPSSDTLCRLAELVLTLNCFEFNGDHYLQLKGVKMGSRLGPVYACIFIGFIEQQFLNTYQGTKPIVFLRYIDDIFGIAPGNPDDLLPFMNFVNTFHPALDFTWEISTTSVVFLDINISLVEGSLVTSVHYKPTDSHSYLNFSSSHPERCKKAIPYSQMLRLRRLCSDDADFNDQATQMATFFKNRGYSHHVISAALQRCQNTTRDDSLLVKTPSEKSDRPTIVLTYHPTTKPVSDILTRNWKILQEHYSTGYIFNEQPMSAFR